MKIRLGSITYAMKAKEMLRSHGVDAAVSKDLRSAAGGCVYAITFADRYRDAAYGILRSGGFDLPAADGRNDKE